MINTMKPINKIIKILILSDLHLFTGAGFITPIFAIFMTEQIRGGDIKTVGYAIGIYWVIKSLVVIPFGNYLDKDRGEKDDLWFVIIGNLLAALAVLGYVFSYLPWHIYFLQGLYAVGMGMNIPGYTAIFTRHIDRGGEAFNWSVRSALTGVGTGVAGALGGIVVSYFGFKILFVGVAVLFLLGALLPYFISRDITHYAQS